MISLRLIFLELFYLFLDGNMQYVYLLESFWRANSCDFCQSVLKRKIKKKFISRFKIFF